MVGLVLKLGQARNHLFVVSVLPVSYHHFSSTDVGIEQGAAAERTRTCLMDNNMTLSAIGLW